MPSKFSQRSDGIEIMDDLQCSGEVVDQTLRELEVINNWLGGNSVTIDGINKLLKRANTNKEVTIADLGCGGGDVLKEIAAWGRQKKIPFRLQGIDANPHIIDFAKSNTNRYPEITYETVNIFSDDFHQREFDIVVATLFTHHFSNKDLSELFRTIVRQSTVGIVINDLHRHWFAYHSIRLLTKFLSKSAMVKYDAPLSVLRAFSRKELVSILQNAGINNFTLRWKWAFRWQIIIPTSLA